MLQELADFLELKKVTIRGSEIHASCPFLDKHLTGKDSRPSFSLNVDKGLYNCFSCSSRGTIENLVAEVKKVSLSKAIEVLQEFGFDRVSVALRDKTEEVRPDVLPEGFLAYFDRVEIDYELYEGEVEGFDCLVYPVRDYQGYLVGALARSKKGRFHKVMWNMKKHYLYGENLVRREVPIVISEGPGDVITLRRCGVNAVGLIGINTSQEQAERLLTLSSDFIVWLDKDKAGATGMQLLHKRLENRANMKYVDPWKAGINGKDPRDCYNNQGKEKVLEVISGAKTYLEWSLSETN